MVFIVCNGNSACMYFCRITNAGLPSGLARLPYLKSIGLKRNCLTSVPRMLGKMHSLEEIYLEDNSDLEVSSCPAQGTPNHLIMPSNCWQPLQNDPVSYVVHAHMLLVNTLVRHRLHDCLASPSVVSGGNVKRDVWSKYSSKR